MEKKDFIKKFLAGLFFLLCLVLIGGAVFVIGLEKGFSEPKFEMEVVFRKVGGLSIGAPVRLSGVTVGAVSNIDFLENEIEGRGVVVTLSLFDKYRAQLYKSVKFSIITEGVLGEKVVEITTVPYFRRRVLSQLIIGEDPLDVNNLAETMGRAAGGLYETSKGMNRLVRELNDVTLEVRRLLHRVEQRIIEGNLFKVF